MFEREDWTLFRELAKLGQKAGVPRRLIPHLVLKELVDNALDVAGPDGFDAGRSGNGFYVQDTGPGFDGDDERIAAMFSINRPLASTKLVRLPTRGALGNGLRVVAGAVLASGGTLRVSTRGRTLRLIPRDDTGGTSAEIEGKYSGPGTRVAVQLGPSLTIDDGVLEWAQSALDLSGGESLYKGKTSPHWYDSDSFYELLKAAGVRTAAEVIGSFDGCAHPKAGRIAHEFVGRPAASLDRSEADRLLTRARESSKPVTPERLGRLGPDVPGLPGYHAMLRGELAFPAARGSLGGVVPCVVEAWAAVADEAVIGVSVNRTPITAPMRAHHDAKSLNLGVFGSGLSARFPAGKRPIRLHLNIDTPFMPITGDGKAPDLSVFLALVEPAIKKAIGRAKLGHRYSKPMEANRVTQKGVILGNLEAAISKAGDAGRLRYSLRQLFYAVRPYVIEALGVQLKYATFTSIITDHENEIGRDLPGIYRDSRGTLYHPHTGEVIPLGTLNVEKYHRPGWTFNKVLYSEKEGFFEVLRDVRWPERHDCALLTSKGFASRAARDVIDFLGGTGEDLTFYCIHDADAAGTMIHQALEQATRARPARKVKIVNLGLEPAEALEMGLQVEQVEHIEKGEGKLAPVAAYVPPEWANWLQANRVELNAMTTPQFLGWLDAKFAGQVGKVVPPWDVLADRLRADVRGVLDRQYTRSILAENDKDGRVDAAFGRLRGTIEGRLTTLRDEVEDGLADDPSRSWPAPLAGVAAAIAMGPDDESDTP